MPHGSYAPENVHCTPIIGHTDDCRLVDLRNAYQIISIYLNKQLTYHNYAQSALHLYQVGRRVQAASLSKQFYC